MTDSHKNLKTGSPSAALPVFGHRSADIFKQLIKQILLFVFALVMLYPILWMIASSLRGQNEIFKNMGLLVKIGRAHV